MAKNRTYFCIDMKSFFASVECAERGLNPFTTNLVVADETRGTGALCLAVSPKMKSLGVKNRCRMFEIPKGIEYIVAKPRMKKYIEYAADIYELYLRHIDKDDIHVLPPALQQETAEPWRCDEVPVGRRAGREKEKPSDEEYGGQVP